MASFTDILNKPMDQIKPPQALPVGTYLAIVDGQPELKKIGQNQTDCVDFKCKLIQAQPDVDQTALAAALDGKTLQDKHITVRHFITEDAIWRLKQFFEHLAIETGSRGPGEVLPETPGHQFYVSLGHRPSQDGQTIYQDVKGTAKV